MINSHLRDSTFILGEGEGRVHLKEFMGQTYRIDIQVRKARRFRSSSWKTVLWLGVKEADFPRGKDAQSAYILNKLDILVDKWYAGVQGYVSEDQVHYTLNPTSTGPRSF